MTYGIWSSKFHSYLTICLEVSWLTRIMHFDKVIFGRFVSSVREVFYMAICQKCGAEVADGYRFCMHCGAPMQQQAQQCVVDPAV